jgi:hypothetical protein
MDSPACADRGTPRLVEHPAGRAMNSRACGTLGLRVRVTGNARILSRRHASAEFLRQPTSICGLSPSRSVPLLDSAPFLPYRVAMEILVRSSALVSPAGSTPVNGRSVAMSDSARRWESGKCPGFPG